MTTLIAFSVSKRSSECESLSSARVTNEMVAAEMTKSKLKLTCRIQKHTHQASGGDKKGENSSENPDRGSHTKLEFRDPPKKPACLTFFLLAEHPRSS